MSEHHTWTCSLKLASDNITPVQNIVEPCQGKLSRVICRKPEVHELVSNNVVTPLWLSTDAILYCLSCNMTLFENEITLMQQQHKKLEYWQYKLYEHVPW